jgi:hypothetical protein
MYEKIVHVPQPQGDLSSPDIKLSYIESSPIEPVGEEINSYKNFHCYYNKDGRLITSPKREENEDSKDIESEGKNNISNQIPKTKRKLQDFLYSTATALLANSTKNFKKYAGLVNQISDQAKSDYVLYFNNAIDSLKEDSVQKKIKNPLYMQTEGSMFKYLDNHLQGHKDHPNKTDILSFICGDLTSLRRSKFHFASYIVIIDHNQVKGKKSLYFLNLDLVQTIKSKKIQKQFQSFIKKYNKDFHVKYLQFSSDLMQDKYGCRQSSLEMAIFLIKFFADMIYQEKIPYLSNNNINISNLFDLLPQGILPIETNHLLSNAYINAQNHTFYKKQLSKMELELQKKGYNFSEIVEIFLLSRHLSCYNLQYEIFKEHAEKNLQKNITLDYRVYCIGYLQEIGNHFGSVKMQSFIANIINNIRDNRLEPDNIQKLLQDSCCEILTSIEPEIKTLANIVKKDINYYFIRDIFTIDRKILTILQGENKSVINDDYNIRSTADETINQSCNEISIPNKMNKKEEVLLYNLTNPVFFKCYNSINKRFLSKNSVEKVHSLFAQNLKKSEEDKKVAITQQGICCSNIGKRQTTLAKFIPDSKEDVEQYIEILRNTPLLNLNQKHAEERPIKRM